MKLELENLNFLHIPVASQTEGSADKLVLLVHGRGGQLKLMKWFSKRLKIPGVDFLCIEAPHPEDVPAMKEPGFSWYLMPEHDGLEESRQKIKDSLYELSQQGFSFRDIAWLGFSQGGVMGIDTALRFEETLAGVVCVSGFCLKPEEYPEAFGKEATNQKILCTHGRRDEIVDFDKATSSYDALVELGINLDFKEFNKPHSFEMKTEIPMIEQRLKDWLEAD